MFEKTENLNEEEAGNGPFKTNLNLFGGWSYKIYLLNLHYTGFEFTDWLFWLILNSQSECSKWAERKFTREIFSIGSVPGQSDVQEGGTFNDRMLFPFLLQRVAFRNWLSLLDMKLFATTSTMTMISVFTASASSNFGTVLHSVSTVSRSGQISASLNCQRDLLIKIGQLFVRRRLQMKCLLSLSTEKMSPSKNFGINHLLFIWRRSYFGRT